MNQGFLNSGGRKNNQRKKTYNVTSTGSITESDGILNVATPLVDATTTKEAVSPSMVDKTVAKKNPSSLVNTTGWGHIHHYLRQKLLWLVIPPENLRWHPDVNLLKEDVGTILVWVKLHGVPVTAFNKDGLSVIGTKLGKVTLVDDDGKPFEKVAYSCEYDSVDEVVSVDNEMANFLSKKDGYGQDIPDKLQAICDKLDITVRGRRRK
nr:hypothetical protein [Tanacetum cinerariifolium]